MNETESRQQSYAIGELAGEFGVTSRALRLYEEEGLLNPRREVTPNSSASSPMA